jgi:hypothetical protein
MQTYPEYPMNEYQQLQNILKQLKDIVDRELKRHQMDSHLNMSTLGLLEEEIIPLLENELNWEPSDEDLGYGSEPPMSADEMHNAAWVQHQELHR